MVLQKSLDDAGRENKKLYDMVDELRDSKKGVKKVGIF